MGYTDEPRPCVVNGSRALFHGWAEMEKPNIEDGKQVGCWKQPVALVDGGEVFARYDWGEADA